MVETETIIADRLGQTGGKEDNMKKIILFLCAVLIAVPAFADPFLVSDFQADAEWFVITGLPLTGMDRINPDPVKEFGIKVDLALLPVGDYNIKAQACNSVWGCSVEVPFAFRRPMLAVGNIRLLP